jgi:hypothetical protein
MVKPCSTPGCETLTYGEVCLGCMQRTARDRQEAPDRAETKRGEEHAATTA